MSDNNLTTQISGTTIEIGHVNQYKEALTGDLVPRNTSGAPEDEAGSFGTDIYRWLKSVVSKMFTNKLSIGAESTESSNPYFDQSASNLRAYVPTSKGFSFYVNNVLKFFVDSDGADGQYLKANSVSLSKVMSGGSAFSPTTNTSTSESTTSTSYIQCSGCTLTISCVANRPVYVNINYVLGGYFSCNADIDRSYVKIVNTTTSAIIQEYGFGNTTVSTRAHPHGGIDPSPAAGNNTYRIEVKTSSNIQWLGIRLVANQI